MSAFKKLIETCDTKIREEMDDFYYISKSRMDNIISNFEGQVKMIADLSEMVKGQQKIIGQLQEELLKEKEVKENNESI